MNKYPIDNKKFIDSVLVALAPFETAKDFSSLIRNVLLGCYSYAINETTLDAMYKEAFPTEGGNMAFVPIFSKYGKIMELINNTVNIIMNDINAVETVQDKQAVITAAMADINAQK
jgi:hypothetical protein